MRAYFATDGAAGTDQDLPLDAAAERLRDADRQGREPVRPDSREEILRRLAPRG